MSSKVNRGGRSRQSVDSTTASADNSHGRNENNPDIASQSPVARRTRTTWDDAAVACLLRLRFQELLGHFRACKTVFETAEAWVLLTSDLNARMDSLFESHQVQAKLKTLRQKWDEHTAANIRAGTERKSRFVESLQLMTQLYQQKLTTPLKQIGKAVPPRSLVSRQQQETINNNTTGGASRYPEPSASAQEEHDEDDMEEQGVGDRDDSGDEEREPAAQSQAQQRNSSSNNNNNNNTVSASNLYDSQRVALEKQHLELFERQVAATEALATHTREKLQVARDKLRAAQQQVQVSRDQVELNLFAIQPDAEDEVAHEYLTLKRKQARDRLKDEFFALRRKQTDDGSSSAPVLSVAAQRTTPSNGGAATGARSSAALRTRTRRLSHELNDVDQSE